MGDLTKNLSRHEMACRCGCGFDTIDFMLVTVIQEYADMIAKQYNTTCIVDIRGGNRCKEHNETVQKKYVDNYVPYSSKSIHMDAKACDVKFFYMKGLVKYQVDPKVVHSYFTKKFPNTFGLGLYHNRNHIDTRTDKARWG